MTVPFGTPSRAVTWIEPTATDDCGVPTVRQTYRPGQSFNVGVTQVNYLFTDSSGNEEVCSFTITGKYCEIFLQAAMQNKKKPAIALYSSKSVIMCILFLFINYVRYT